MKIEITEEELEGCMTAEDYADLWDYARLRTKDELIGLLAFAEMLDRSRDPVSSFASSMLLWLDHAREVIRQTEEAELPGEPGSSRRVH